MAQMYRDHAHRLRRQHADRRHCAIRRTSRFRTSCARSWALTFSVVVATETRRQEALERYYGAEQRKRRKHRHGMEDDRRSGSSRRRRSNRQGRSNLTDVEALADSAPVRKLLNMVLLMAIKDHASDLHFEPFEDEFHIRIKADGVLYEMVPPPRHLAFAITTRIKVMANLDIAERRLPQDGRIELTVGGHPVDLRVSVLPTMFGESVVMRVLDRSVVVARSERRSAWTPPTLKTFREAIDKPNGIVLVTGPTGSGKTTTLYSALNELNSIEDKLITTEDPVEYDIDGIVQVPIDPRYRQYVRSHACEPFLRQDPDKILVGEIRDLETAEIAVQASLTGHLVFSTLHTNDAPSTITRLKDMGVPTFLITATVEAILAQRLVRRVCSQCREEYDAPARVLEDLELTIEQMSRASGSIAGRGCEVCNNTGYKGRVGLVRADDHEQRPARHDHGQRCRPTNCGRWRSSMAWCRSAHAGIESCFDGITTPDEVVRETILEA